MVTSTFSALHRVFCPAAKYSHNRFLRGSCSLTVFSQNIAGSSQTRFEKKWEKFSGRAPIGLKQVKRYLATLSLPE
jgi:hypothetical protein